MRNVEKSRSKWPGRSLAGNQQKLFRSMVPKAGRRLETKNPAETYPNILTT